MKNVYKSTLKVNAQSYEYDDTQAYSITVG
jgi:hypothetical protein